MLGRWLLEFRKPALVEEESGFLCQIAFSDYCSFTLVWGSCKQLWGVKYVTYECTVLYSKSMPARYFGRGKKEHWAKDKFSSWHKALSTGVGCTYWVLCVATECAQYSFQEQRINTSKKCTQEGPVCQVELPPSLVVFMKTLFKWAEQEKSWFLDPPSTSVCSTATPAVWDPSHDGDILLGAVILKYWQHIMGWDCPISYLLTLSYWLLFLTYTCSFSDCISYNNIITVCPLGDFFHTLGKSIV